MLQPRETKRIPDCRFKKSWSLDYRIKIMYYSYHKQNCSLALLATLILTMVHIEASQATNQPLFVSPTPTLPAIHGDAHNRTGRGNIRYEREYKNGVLHGSVSEKILDEARYNLATHVMSNGVELIIASEKGKPIEKLSPTTNTFSNNSQPILITQHSDKPLTLAPSTIQNQMILTLPSTKQNTLIIPDNSFITKICLTTYTYFSTYVENGSSNVISQKMVISNTLTEERKNLHASNPMITDATFSMTPELVVGMFPTTYYYFNSIEKGQLDSTQMVVTSKYTIINKITRPGHFLTFSNSSNGHSPSTNTYFSQILLTKTEFDEFRAPTYVTIKKNLTQVVITESLPATISAYINTKGTDYISNSDKKINSSASIISLEHSDYMVIYSTKSLLETLTFCTATLNSTLTATASYIAMTVCKSDPKVSTYKLRLHPHVIKSMATNTVGSSLLNSDLLYSIKSELILKKRNNQRQTIITTATLLGGEIIQVTAVNIIKKPNLSYITTLKKSTELLNSAMSLINATSITNERKSTLSSKLEDFSESISNSSEKTSLHMYTYKKNITDLTLSESENSEVFIKKNKKNKPSQYTSQDTITDNINLERLRPMLNAVAHLFKKQLINTQKVQLQTQTYIKEHPKTNRVQSYRILPPTENPVYIPLQQTLKGKYLGTTGIKQATSDFLGKLRINTLHIYPPKMDELINCKELNISKHSSPLEYEATPMVYKDAFINTGIPISPGEIITASANVIFGRPNIDVGVSQTLLASNRTTTTYRHSTSLKSLYPSLPFHSAILQNSLSYKNGIIIEYASLLKPPPLPVNQQVLLQYPSTFQSQLGRKRTPGKIRLSPTELIRKSPGIDHYSSQSQINMNTDFYNNQILDIFRVPQILGTNLPSTKRYLSMLNTYDNSFNYDCSLDTLKPTLSYTTPLGVSKFSALQQVNLKNDVISHTINMHAPPLMFKGESESIPYATTVKGHIDSFIMPHIKIPLHDDKIEVQLTPNRKRVFPIQYKDLQADEAKTKIKLRNNNLSNFKNAQHEFPFEEIKSQSGLNKYSSLYRNELSSPSPINLDYADNSNGKPTRKIHKTLKENMKLLTEPDQKAEYSNDSMHFLKLNTTKKYDLMNNTASNKWASMIKHISLTLPKSIRKNISSNKHIQSSNKDKVFLTTGEHFSLIEYSTDSVNYKLVPKTNMFNTSYLPIADEGSKLKSTIFKESNLLRLTSSDDPEFKTSFIGHLNSHQFSSVIPVFNASTFLLISHSDSNQNIKMLEPSEMLHDDNTSISKKTLEWDINSVVVKSSKTVTSFIYKSSHTQKTTNYFNILKPTKTKTTDLKNLSEIIKSFDANKYISFHHSIINTSKNYAKKPISISFQKVLISSRINMQSQVIPKSGITNVSQISKSFKNSDYVAKPSNVIIGPSSSGTADIMKSEYRGSKHAVNRNESSFLSTLDSTRDELVFVPSDLNSIHIGAVIADSFSKTNYIKKSNSIDGCHPPCRSNKNEICVTYANYSESLSLCECRPSFGRMFPDRPCKPTYTYEMKIQTNWTGKHSLKPSDTISSNSLFENSYIYQMLLEAADRMVMQSDYRDVFHGVQLRSVLADEKDKLTVKFLLQLSENTDEDQLTTEFKKYLRQSNFSIGGTEFYTSRNSLHLLVFKDFDECRNENFNDCSIDAHCFNLIGSYTCSCKEGYTDISDNALYPGRHCSDNLIGCDMCNYNGKCMNKSVSIGQKAITTCKCYSWYAGTRCQVNMKIIIIFLFTSGTILSILLLFFFLIINTKHKKQGNRKASQLLFTPSTLNTSIITSSTSEKPYNVVKTPFFKQIEPKKICVFEKYMAASTCNLNDDLNIKSTIEEHGSPVDHSPEDEDQTDRSLTLMIPRAKYRIPYVAQNSYLNNNANNMENTEHKDIDNMIACRQFTHNLKNSTTSDNILYRGITTPRTALISAGFEVSAVVNDTNVLEIPIRSSTCPYDRQ
ncbi:mucin-3B isoform X4 [Drosophila takahashii]|uniref:mucin-3B isoform X4 n=1 Tax=Drosophila takahashii TaxID=29030 RepID=UPI0038995166